jgi:hypothetical protein
LNGKTVSGNKTLSKFHSVDISNLRKGIYQVEITDGTNKLIKQLVIE